MGRRVLVAGVGNLFLGDDGFGVAVAQQLAGERLREGVRVEDFGIRGVHLAHELLEGYELLVLVDAVAHGESPGTVTLFERPTVPSGSPPPTDGPAVADAHGLDPDSVLELLARLGGRVGRVLVVGCEPAEIVERMGLSAPVAAAVEPAAAAVREILEQYPETGGPAGSGSAGEREEDPRCSSAS